MADCLILSFQNPVVVVIVVRIHQHEIDDGIELRIAATLVVIAKTVGQRQPSVSPRPEWSSKAATAVANCPGPGRSRWWRQRSPSPGRNRAPARTQQRSMSCIQRSTQCTYLWSVLWPTTFSFIDTMAVIDCIATTCNGLPSAWSQGQRSPHTENLRTSRAPYS